MEINITKETCKRIIDNPASTEMERILAQYAIRLHARIGKVENDCNDLKNVIKSMLAPVFRNASYLIEQEGKNHGATVTRAVDAGTYTTPKAIAEIMFPPMVNPPFSQVNETTNTEDEND